MLPLAQQRVFCSRNIDQVRAHVAQVLCPHDFMLDPSVRELDTRHHHAEFGRISLSYLHYGAGTTVNLKGLEEFFLLETPLSGRSTVTSEGDELDVNPQHGCLLGPDKPLSIRWSSDCSKLLVKVSRTTLEEHLMHMLDSPLTMPLVFESRVDFSTREGQSLRRMVDYIFADAGVSDDMGSTPVMQRSLEESLLTCVLWAQPHNYSGLLSRSLSPAVPRHVRRAEEFMRACAQDAITLMDVVAAAGVSPRTLQLGFKRFRNETPMAYLRNYRLDQVKADLERAEPGVAVNSIASKWGFADMSRLAVLYRQRFGELPRNTLRYR